MASTLIIEMLAASLLHMAGDSKLTPQVVFVTRRGRFTGHRLEVLGEHLAEELGGIEIVIVEAPGARR